MTGLFRGAWPRALHSGGLRVVPVKLRGLGGALWLGAFEWTKLLLWPRLAK